MADVDPIIQNFRSAQLTGFYRLKADWINFFGFWMRPTGIHLHCCNFIYLGYSDSDKFNGVQVMAKCSCGAEAIVLFR